MAKVHQELKNNVIVVDFAETSGKRETGTVGDDAAWPNPSISGANAFDMSKWRCRTRFARTVMGQHFSAFHLVTVTMSLQ